MKIERGIQYFNFLKIISWKSSNLRINPGFPSEFHRPWRYKKSHGYLYEVNNIVIINDVKTAFYSSVMFLSKHIANYVEAEGFIKVWSNYDNNSIGIVLMWDRSKKKNIKFGFSGRGISPDPHRPFGDFENPLGQLAVPSGIFKKPSGLRSGDLG